MKLIIIPDIHTHYEKAERIMQKYKNTHKFVLIGDYFDDFNDDVVINELTAQWLKTSLNDPNRVHLIGNHDLHYFPGIDVYCSGFSLSKKEAINKILTDDDYLKLKFYHYENKCYFSHAGFTKHWFMNPLDNGLFKDVVDKRLTEALEKIKFGNIDEKHNNAIWSSDHFRGGRSKKGGILWNDWRNIDIIPGVKQVVGHTPLHKIISITDDITNSRITNVDNSGSSIYFSEVLEISENNELNIIDTSYV